MIDIAEEKRNFPVNKMPPWFKQPLPDAENLRELKDLFQRVRVHTVCESARCPNMGQCWGQRVATFMILGDTCTRACRFCAVKIGRPCAVDSSEPENIAQTVKHLNLKYVVITSVTRDDLQDGGAAQFSQTVASIRKVMPDTNIELLIPDFNNNLENIQTVVKSKPDVIGHNMETVRRVFAEIRPQAEYQRSLEVLRTIRQVAPAVLIKSSFMVGLGEAQQEIVGLMQDLLAVGCDLLTIGQYLAPTQLKRHIKVNRFVAPEEFAEYERLGLELGFKYVKSGPVVRSSYLAEEGYRVGARRARVKHKYNKTIGKIYVFK